VIDKRSHPAVRRLRDARAGDGPFLFVEGVRLAEELLASALPPSEFFFTDALKKGKALLPRLEGKGAQGLPMTDDVMSFVSDLEAPPGLIVLARRPAPRWEEAVKASPNPLVVVLDGAQTPANAGAVVRAAEAAGACAVLQSSGGADLLGPKALRASAGSAFRLPTAGGRDAGAWAEVLSALGLACVAADARGEKDHTDADWTGPTALFLGGEAGFSSEKVRALAKVRVPLAPPVESLNVAVAAGVLVFEAARQRRGAGR
jgi:TrmH family RNA methyltransferase